MIHSLHIKGYRGLNRFELDGLGQINLLVGTNNSGKTSVLESLYLLATAGDPYSLWNIVNRRGERLDEDSPRRQSTVEIDISHLFHGHELKPGATFSFSAKNGKPERSLNYVIGEAPKKNREIVSEPESPFNAGLALHLTGSPTPQIQTIPLTSRGGLSANVAFDLPRRTRPHGGDPSLSTQYVSTDSLSRDELTSMWGKIVLTDSEQRVLTALRSLDSKIERIANTPPPSTPLYYTSAGISISSRGGFMVKRTNEPPIPIGSMGDGMWRMLALAIVLSRSANGMLLIDEIDTGLHYTVMVDMWKLVAQTAKELGVQVFATTHSYDCVKSLASICRSDVETSSQVTIQRIDPSRERAVAYSEAEITVASERHIEVR